MVLLLMMLRPERPAEATCTLLPMMVLSQIRALTDRDEALRAVVSSTSEEPLCARLHAPEGGGDCADACCHRTVAGAQQNWQLEPKLLQLFWGRIAPYVAQLGSLGAAVACKLRLQILNPACRRDISMRVGFSIPLGPR